MKPNIKSMFVSAKNTMIENSPKILLGVGIGGMVVTVIVAVRATPKAMNLCDIVHEDKRAAGEKDTKLDYFKSAWKCYIPTAIIGAASIGCILESQSISTRRTAALATAYKIAETSLGEYREKVVETIGEKKEEAIQDKIAKKHLDEAPKDTKIVETGKGKTLFLEPTSGRCLRSDIEDIRRAINDLNSDLISDSQITLNDYYYSIGLHSTDIGDELGWNYEGLKSELLDVQFSAQLNENNEPCIVLEHKVPPKYLRVDY